MEMHIYGILLLYQLLLLFHVIHFYQFFIGQKASQFIHILSSDSGEYLYNKGISSQDM